MLIGGKTTIGPETVKEYFSDNGLSLSLLKNTNSMSFNLIGGAGEGYFLLNSDDAATITTETTTLVIYDTFAGTTKSYTVNVLNKFTLHPTAQTTRHLVVVHVAEEKYKLGKLEVARNYNLIRRELIADGVAVKYWKPDDGTLQSTLEVIITAISGLTVTYSAPTYTPYEVNIQGMDVVKAIDLLCAAYGLVWTVDAGVLTVRNITTGGVPSNNKISDIRHSKLTRQLSDLQIAFPVISNGTQRNSRVSRDVNYGTSGEFLDVYMPFFPAIYTKEEVLQNSAALTAAVTILQPNFEGINNLVKGYIVYNAYVLDAGNTEPISLIRTFADYGSGPRTIWHDEDYPYLAIPQPYTFDQDKDSNITFTITSVTTASGGSFGYYAGKKIATVVVNTTSCNLGDLIGTTVDVVDDVGCVFDLSNEALVGLKGWASKRVAQSLASGAVSGDLTPCHWSADDRCCP